MSQVPLPSSARFPPGERVRIVAGTFTGMSGTIITADEAVQRVPGAVTGPEVDEGRMYWLLVSVFGQDIPVELAREVLVPA